MVLSREGLQRSAAEAPVFFFGLKNPTAVNAPGTEIWIDPLPRVSAVANGGDWGHGVYGLTPSWFWRLLIGLARIIMYVISLRWLESFIRDFASRGEIALADRQRLVWPAYLAGGVVLTAAAILNPITPSLILISGIGASFGLNFGLLLLPRLLPTTVTAMLPTRFASRLVLTGSLLLWVFPDSSSPSSAQAFV